MSVLGIGGVFRIQDAEIKTVRRVDAIPLRMKSRKTRPAVQLEDLSGGVRKLVLEIVDEAGDGATGIETAERV